MRTKEKHNDYRYFPEPDLLPISISYEHIDALQKCLPELPASRKTKFMTVYCLSEYHSDIIISNKFMSDFFEECVSLGAQTKSVSNWLIGDVSKTLNELGLTPDKIPFKPCDLAEMISLINNETISNSTAKSVLAQMFKSKDTPKKIVENLGLVQISDESRISAIVDEVLLKNSKSVEDFKNGNKRAFGFLVGQAMKLSNGSLNPIVLNRILENKLKHT